MLNLLYNDNNIIDTSNAAFNLIPENLSSQRIFLCIDDTMVQKSGKKFEEASKLSHLCGWIL